MTNNNLEQETKLQEQGVIHFALTDIENIPVEEMVLEYQNRILKLANQVAQSQLQKGEAITSPDNCRKAIRHLLQGKQEEVMAVLFLDTKHRIIAFEELFQGTIDSAMIYTRVLVKRVLANNSSAIILAHNHPSGVCEPSRADISITQQINKAMGLIDVRLLDHFVVSVEGIYSFAEHGEM